MHKRGQITVLIMLTIVIVISIILYIIVANKPEPNYSTLFLSGQKLKEQESIIRNEIFDCIEQTTKQAVITIGVQGGYVNPPQKRFDIDGGFLAYYYYEGEINIPSQTDVEESLAQYVNSKLPECLESKEYPIPVTVTKPTTLAILNDFEVMFIIDSTVQITTGSESSYVELRDKKFYTQSYIKGMLEIATYLTEYHRIDPKYHCLNCLSNMGRERGLNIDIFELPLQNKTTEVVIHENKTNTPFAAFIYLNKYTGEEKSPLFDE